MAITLMNAGTRHLERATFVGHGCMVALIGLCQAWKGKGAALLINAINNTEGGWGNDAK